MSVLRPCGWPGRWSAASGSAVDFRAIVVSGATGHAAGDRPAGNSARSPALERGCWVPQPHLLAGLMSAGQDIARDGLWGAVKKIPRAHAARRASGRDQSARKAGLKAG